MNSVEDILNHVKPNGRFQAILTFIMCLIHGPVAVSLWLTTFIAVKSPWRCMSNSTSCVSNQTFPITDDVMCTLNREEWEFVATPESTITVYFDAQCGAMWTTYLATSGLFIGWAVGSPFISWIADKYGRKCVVFPSLFGIILFGFLSIFSPNIYVFIVLRFVVGLCVSGNFHVLFVLIGEFVDSKLRPLVINIILLAHALWISLLCLAAYFIKDWKFLTMFSTLPFLIGLLFFKFVPESPHWLHTNASTKSFLKVIEQISYWNKTCLPENLGELQITRHSSKGASKSNFLELFQPKYVCLLSMKLMITWFTLGLLYYGLSMSADNLTGSTYRDFFILTAIEVPADLLTSYLCERLGRRKTVAGNILLGSICCLAVTFIPESESIKFVRLAIGILGKLLITIALNGFYPWTMELYGTDNRANGLGLGNIACRIGGASAPWIAQGLIQFSKMGPFLMMGSLGVLSGCVALTLSDTKGMELKTVTCTHTEDVTVYVNEGMQ